VSVLKDMLILIVGGVAHR